MYQMRMFGLWVVGIPTSAPVYGPVPGLTTARETTVHPTHQSVLLQDREGAFAGNVFLAVDTVQVLPAGQRKPAQPFLDGALFRSEPPAPPAFGFCVISHENLHP